MEDKQMTVSVPIELIDATHRIGFFKLVQKLGQECESHREAYEKAEAQLEMYGMARRYANYDSFRNQYRIWVRDTLEQSDLGSAKKRLPSICREPQR